MIHLCVDCEAAAELPGLPCRCTACFDLLMGQSKCCCPGEINVTYRWLDEWTTLPCMQLDGCAVFTLTITFNEV